MDNADVRELLAYNRAAKQAACPHRGFMWWCAHCADCGKNFTAEETARLAPSAPTTGGRGRG